MSPYFKAHHAKTISNEQGNILIVCVVLIMILTSLGIYSLNSTSIEQTLAASDKRENDCFQNAEAGLKFVISNMNLIFENTDRVGNVLYTVVNGVGFGGNIEYNADPLPWPAGTSYLKGIINPLAPVVIPQSQLTPLRDMEPLGSSAIVFTFSINNTPTALIEIKPICRFPVNNNALTAMANSVPIADHLTAPPDKYDSSEFVGRNYMVTSTGLNAAGTLSGVILQNAIKIAAKSDQVAHLEGL